MAVVQVSLFIGIALQWVNKNERITNYELSFIYFYLFFYFTKLVEVVFKSHCHHLDSISLNVIV